MSHSPLNASCVWTVLAMSLVALCILACLQINALCEASHSPPSTLRIAALITSVDGAQREWISALLEHLVVRGHQVHLVDISVDPYNKTIPEGHRDLPAILERLTWSYRNVSVLTRVRDVHLLGRALSERQLSAPNELQAKLKSLCPIDVLLLDYHLNDAVLGAVDILGSPAVVLLSPYAAMPSWIGRLVGIPPTPAVFPHLTWPVDNPMTFFQRLFTLALYWHENLLYTWSHLPAQRKLAAQVWGEDVQDPKITMVLSNVIPGFYFDAPTHSRAVPVAGLEFIRNKKRHLHIHPLSKPLNSIHSNGLVVLRVPQSAHRFLGTIFRDLENEKFNVLLLVDNHVAMAHPMPSNFFVAETASSYEALSDPVIGNKIESVVWIGCTLTGRAAVTVGLPQVAVPLSLDERVFALQLSKLNVSVILDVSELISHGGLSVSIKRSQTLRDNALQLSTALNGNRVGHGIAKNSRRRATLSVEAAVHLARLPRPVGQDLSLASALLVDVGPVLAVFVIFACIAILAFCALLLTLLCYRKKYSKRKTN